MSFNFDGANLRRLINVIPSPVGGGAELLVRELHKNCLGKGLDSHVVFFSSGNSELGENEYVLGRSIRSPLNVFRLRDILVRLSSEVDGHVVVHAHLTWVFFYIVIAVYGIPGIKLVYTEHSTHNKRRDIPFFWVLERFFYRKFEWVVCISEGVEKALSRWVGSVISSRLIVIPNGGRIYSLHKRPSTLGRPLRFVSVGSLSDRKNFATTILAIDQLAELVESYVIIGEGNLRGNLESIVKDKNLEGKIKLVGWSNAIESHLHQADMLLIPSLWEGFGLVAVEGMSTGLPVVASNVDGLREVLGEFNPAVTLVSQPESVSEWVCAIRRMSARLEEFGSGTLAHCSRTQAEKFTIDSMVDRYLRLYLSL